MGVGDSDGGAANLAYVGLILCKRRDGSSLVEILGWELTYPTYAGGFVCSAKLMLM